MQKKYIIILVIAVVGAVGMYLYQDQKVEKDLKSHHNRQYNRIIEAAQQSSTAGLVRMAGALNKYEEKNGAYPADLSALYPDYVPVKAFIDDIQWNYKPTSKDFYLSKTITTKGNKVLTASIGPDLMPQENSGIMVASIKDPKPLTSRAENQPSKKASKKVVSKGSLSKSKSMVKALKPNIPSSGQKNSRSKSKDSTTPVSVEERPAPIFEKISSKKLTEEERFVRGVIHMYLVWKNPDGSLGFSNVQYPTSKKLAVYDNGEWVQFRNIKPPAKSQKEVQPNKNK